MRIRDWSSDVCSSDCAGQRNLEGFTRSQGKIYILERERRSEADIIVGPIDEEARIIIIGGAGKKASRENVPQDLSIGPGLLNQAEGSAHRFARTGYKATLGTLQQRSRVGLRDLREGAGAA